MGPRRRLEPPPLGGFRQNLGLVSLDLAEVYLAPPGGPALAGLPPDARVGARSELAAVLQALTGEPRQRRSLLASKSRRGSVTSGLVTEIRFSTLVSLW